LATIEITRSPQGAAVPSDFVGFSIELDVAQNIYFGPPGIPNTVFLNLIANLGSGTLRMGGDTEDTSCWTGVPPPNPAICQYTLETADFESWANTSSATHWPLLVGLNLAENNTAGAPQWTWDEVTEAILPAMKAAPGSSLLGMEIGNELNLYYTNPIFRPPTYNVTGQITDLLDYLSILKGSKATQSITFAAPAYYNPNPTIIADQVQPLVNYIQGKNPANLGLVTLHWYPLNVSQGPSPTAANLLAPQVVTASENAFNAALAAMAPYGLAVQIGETNSVSGEGQPGLSDTQAAALWALDYMLDMARIGISRLNVHIHDGSSYDPVLSTSPSPGVYVNQVEPIYYAMYAFGAAKRLSFLPLTTTTSANVRAYALSTCPTCAITVFVINKDLTASGTVQIALSAPAAGASLLQLAAPALSSPAASVTYGGQQFSNSTGLLTGTLQSTPVFPQSNGTYTFTLNNATAAVLIIQQ
jgi:hypothetical protein